MDNLHVTIKDDGGAVVKTGTSHIPWPLDAVQRAFNRSLLCMEENGHNHCACTCCQVGRAYAKWASEKFGIDVYKLGEEGTGGD